MVSTGYTYFNFKLLKLVYSFIMKLRFVHILILTLFLFQNAWAMEQTYLVFCETQDITQEVEHHSHDEEHPAEHDHGICNDCCHLSTSFVGITENPLSINTHYEQDFTIFVTKKLYSIYSKPVIPPPII